MIIRLSQKLAKKIKVSKLVEKPLDENQYADWSANVFNVGRTQYVILCNTKSMYSCVMYGNGITNDNTFIQRSLSLIREFMEDDGKESVYEQHIIPATRSVTFAKSLNRSVIGSMNELVMAADAVLSDDVAPHSVGTFLNDFLLSAIAADGDHGYGKPKDAFERLTSVGT
ncbi:DUF6933 domain-containing protein [Fuerstiella marisgermanici]|uniref:DUF6933 domain-containing protein n=1 Tax=Fuerstiella marisgermanici TaxID=1891926 RepID=A0A1P8WGX2_9PLAN|nr:hypothetical protein [Fuerstiella marisgermanici]APZ93331.1 hypothetical protein Fuma_02948 [Fuerstiella marisgermanici]